MLRISYNDGAIRMPEWVGVLGPLALSEATNPNFLAYLFRLFPNGPIIPENRDFDGLTDVKSRRRYRAAQARRLCEYAAHGGMLRIE